MLSTFPSSIRVLLGFGVCLGLSLAAMEWVAPRGWMDHPAGRRLHARPTPRTGGMALLFALAGGLWAGGVNLPIRPEEWGFVFLMGFIGLVDDRFDLRARWKALMSLVASAVLAWLTWDTLRQAGPHLPLFFGHLATKTGLALLLLWAWYWSIPQACNLIDGMNGLAMGYFLLLAAAMDLPLGASGQGAYLIGVLGALFLLNWPRGWQFLGDCGSLTLGTLFAILGVKLLAVQSPNHLLWAFAYPAIDVLMVMAIRWSNGRPLGEGDRNHFHHHWQAVLGGRPHAALLLTLLPAFACTQILQDYEGHRLVAWIGLAWLLLTAGWFIRRGTGAGPGAAPAEETMEAEAAQRSSLA